MAQEIERKFLVRSDVWKPRQAGVEFRQGYLSTVKERVVRIRLAGGEGFLTVKGITRGLSRLEFEYAIPAKDAAQMLDEICERPLIEKVRFKEQVGQHTWEIDVFRGDNEGLTLAEIELSNESEQFDKPAWVGDEVSADPRYFNNNLATNPYRLWRS